MNSLITIDMHDLTYMAGELYYNFIDLTSPDEQPGSPEGFAGRNAHNLPSLEGRGLRGG